MRVLVCGGRDYDEATTFNKLETALGPMGWVWSEIDQKGPISVLIHGGARGADEGAAKWGRSEHIKVLEFKANWKKHGKAAGPLRNSRMLDDGKPDLVIAFPGGKGTADMVRKARAAGIEVREVRK